MYFNLNIFLGKVYFRYGLLYEDLRHNQLFQIYFKGLFSTKTTAQIENYLRNYRICLVGREEHLQN